MTSTNATELLCFLVCSELDIQRSWSLALQIDRLPQPESKARKLLFQAREQPQPHQHTALGAETNSSLDSALFTTTGPMKGCL
jgi:hypothetical protein